MTDHTDALTPIAVGVLALLREGDMHPYEMMRLMRQRRVDRLFAITNGTFYHTVARLERWGLVAEAGVDRDGRRPERTTYSLTDAGAHAVSEWVRRELVRADRPAELRVALAEAHNLSRAEVLGLLAERREMLARERETLVDSLAGAREHDVPDQYLVEPDRQSALLSAELEWLDGLIARLAQNVFPWGPDEPHDRSERYFADREAARR